METSFQVVFSGNLRPGVTPAQAEAALAADFGLAPAHAAALVRVTELTVLKRGLDQAGAVRYLQALASAGLVATAQPMAVAGTAPPPAGPAGPSPAPSPVPHPAPAQPVRRPAPEPTATSAARPAPAGEPAPPEQAPPRRSTSDGRAGSLGAAPRPGAPTSPFRLAAPTPRGALELTPKSAARCPRCGAEAVVGGECGACGIIVEKFRSAEAQRRARERLFTATPVRGWAQPDGDGEPPLPASTPASAAWQAPARRPGQARGPSVTGGLVLIFALLFGVIGAFMGPQLDPAVGPASGPDRSATGPVARDRAAPAYTRPTAAPNGAPWPTVADYVGGYQQLNTGGYSNVHIDNARGRADVFLKLYTLDGPRPRAARVMFIPAHRQMTVNNVGAGRYDIRFRNLDSGRLVRSEPFELTESHSAAGVQYSEYTLTLYTVPGGNATMYPLSEGEF